MPSVGWSFYSPSVPGRGPECSAVAARQTVVVRGHKIAYYEAGKGSPVILIHGLGADSRHWAANIDPLSQNFRVIAIDMIGYGQSDKPVIRYTAANFADYLRGFMQALKIPKSSLVGNSLGGWVSLDLAIRHPQMVDKLVLVDSAGLPPDRGFENAGRRTEEPHASQYPLVFRSDGGEPSLGHHRPGA